MKNRSGAVLVVLVVMLTVSFPIIYAVDWGYSFRPAALKLARGQSPYGAEHGHRFCGPVWALFPLIPLTWLPEVWGGVVLSLMNLIAFLYVLRKRGASSWGAILFLLSPVVIYSLWAGNLDGLALLGLVLPPRWGLFFLAFKPQIGLGIAVFWFVEAVREKEWARLLDFLPVGVAILISCIVFGPWFLDAGFLVDVKWNTSIWPAGLPLGLLALWTSFKRRDDGFALAATPLFSPYVGFFSYSAPLLALVKMPMEMLIVDVGLWVWASFLAARGI